MQAPLIAETGSSEEMPVEIEQRKAAEPQSADEAAGLEAQQVEQDSGTLDVSIEPNKGPDLENNALHNQQEEVSRGEPREERADVQGDAAEPASPEQHDAHAGHPAEQHPESLAEQPSE